MLGSRLLAIVLNEFDKFESNTPYRQEKFTKTKNSQKYSVDPVVTL